MDECESKGNRSVNLTRIKARIPNVSLTGVYIILFFVSYLLFPVIKHYDDEWISNTRLYNNDVFLSAFSWSIAGLISFLIGFSCIRYVPIDRLVSNRLNRFVIQKNKALRAWIISQLLIGCYFAYILKLYSLQQLLYEREETFRGIGITLFLFSAILIYSNIFALLSFYYYKSKWIIFAQIVLLLIVGFGSRGLVLIFLLSLILINSSKVRLTLNKVIKLLIFTVVFVSLLVGLVIVRTPDLNGVPVWFLKRSTANTFEEGEMFMAVYDHYRNNLLYGRTLFDIRYIFYPRQIFPDKPTIWGKAVFEQDLGFLANSDDLGGSSVVFGQLSELYANFGGAGIIIGMWVWGSFFGFLESVRKNRSPNSLGFMLYLMSMYYLLWIFRHGLLGIIQVGVIPVSLLPFVIILFYSRNVVRKTAEKFSASNLPA